MQGKKQEQFGPIEVARIAYCICTRIAHHESDIWCRVFRSRLWSPPRSAMAMACMRQRASRTAGGCCDWRAPSSLARFSLVNASMSHPLRERTVFSMQLASLLAASLPPAERLSRRLDKSKARLVVLNAPRRFAPRTAAWSFYNSPWRLQSFAAIINKSLLGVRARQTGQKGSAGDRVRGSG